MSKQPNAPIKIPTDLTNVSKSTFTLTFAVEIIDFDITATQDPKEGWLDLGPCLKSLKLQYQLYYGQPFDVEISIFEQAARLSCGLESCWVRTWQFLDRRWLTFSIRHAFPVKVADLRDFEAVVNVYPGSGTGAKPGVLQVFFPRLDFGQRRYFGHVMEGLQTKEQMFLRWIREWIWNLVVEYIPPSPLDGSFNIPYPVADIRHQDTILYKIEEEILNRSSKIIEQHKNEISPPTTAGKDKGKKPVEKNNFGIKLSGDAILAGTGRLVAFEPFGDRPPDLGEVIILLASANLPAPEDDPIVFINIGHLFNAPLEEFKKMNISHLYTRWTLGDEVHNSEPLPIEFLYQDEINFKDSHALILNSRTATAVTAIFLEDPYMIELRGIRSPSETTKADLFGYNKRDRDYGRVPERLKLHEEDEKDFIIAITKINSRSLARGLNTYINGEYSLYPPRMQVSSLTRQAFCTNDINLIKDPLKPKLIVPGCLVLTVQMTLEVSMGIAGCKPPKIVSCYSRLFCIINDRNIVVEIILKMRIINDDLSVLKPEELLTGFALDTGNEVVLFVEGPRDGKILNIWEMTEEFYPKIKPVFSTSSRFSARVYADFLEAAMPFLVLKMHVPLSLILVCPAIYARPALPIPARNAVLKLGRLIQHKHKILPPRCKLLTVDELRSLRLELCVPPQPTCNKLTTGDKGQQQDRLEEAGNWEQALKNNSAHKINWGKS